MTINGTAHPTASHPPANGVYPMRVAARLTGLTADTIRVWERRYQAVRPERTLGNKRRYSDSQVRRLVLLRRATELGHSIGQVARLEDDDLRRILGEGDPGDANAASLYDALVEDYLAAVLTYQVRDAETILTRTAAIVPPMQLTFDVILPLMRRIGELWGSKDLRIAHEHIVSGQLRSLLGTLMRHAEPMPGATRVIVATPPKHLHEFGAIIGAFIAASRGYEPIYLGTNLPLEEIREAATQSGAKLILMSVARDCDPEERDALLRGFEQLSKNHEVWLGVPSGHALAEEEGPIRVLHRYEDLDQALVAEQSNGDVRAQA
ncbi:MAG: MerR family transcriptional regulator [Polyangiales bacterium]